MGIFISITCDEKQISPDVARQLAATCPVDIFAVDADDNGTERLIIKADQVDECTLCQLCLKLVAPEAIVIRKLYLEPQPKTA